MSVLTSWAAEHFGEWVRIEFEIRHELAQLHALTQRLLEAGVDLRGARVTIGSRHQIARFGVTSMFGLPVEVDRDPDAPPRLGIPLDQ